MGNESERWHREHSEEMAACLQLWGEGDQLAYSRLFELVLDQIKRMASRELHRRRRVLTWSTTELGNEIVVRLLKHKPNWKDPEHFFNAAAMAMFQLIIDHSRSRGRRLDGQRQISLEDEAAWDQAVGGVPVDMDRLLDLRRALDRLTRFNRRWAAIAVMRLNFGMKAVEIAAQLGIAENTVNNIWPRCRLYLAAELRHWR